MADEAAWSDPKLTEFLAEQLRDGRLALVLGAGASFGFGLPGWHDLTILAANQCGCPVHPSKTDEQIADDVRRRCGDAILFAETVRAALYQKHPFDFDVLMQSSLMRALGALAMPSARGHVSQIVSFNFDDLLETYLNFYGFAVEAVAVEPSWQSAADTVVFHQHGLLPVDTTKAVTKITFAQRDFDEIAVDVKNAWRRRVIPILTSHTCVFVGLSGNDSNLRQMLIEAHATHVSRRSNDRYWGVRFSDDVDDPNRDMWKENGITQITVATYDKVPERLLAICQRATALWQATR